MRSCNLPSAPLLTLYTVVNVLRIVCPLSSCCAQDLLKAGEAALLQQNFGPQKPTTSAEQLQEWEAAAAALVRKGAAINEQEAQLGAKLTYYADLEEVTRTLKEVGVAREAAAAAAEAGAASRTAG